MNSTRDTEHIVLIDEDGVEHHFKLHELLQLDRGLYALLRSIEAEDELVILKVEGPVENGHLVTLDDDEWDMVAAHLDDVDIHHSD